MIDDMEAPPPAVQGAILTPPPPIDGGVNRVTANSMTKPQNDEDPAISFIESVRNVFAPCVGVVDAASIYMGNCRFGKDAYDNNVGDGIAMRLRTGAMQHKAVQKRDGETLEIPANAGFDDDVSAISAHTLEEMERLRQVQQNSKLQMLTPPQNNGNRFKSLYGPKGSVRSSSAQIKVTRGSFVSKQLWSMPRPPVPEDECSIGVSTSGSSSAEDEPPRITTKGNRKGAKNSPRLKNAHYRTTRN